MLCDDMDELLNLVYSMLDEDKIRGSFSDGSCITHTKKELASSNRLCC